MILTYRFRKDLFKNAWSYLKIFGVGILVYPIFSSSYYVIIGKPFWNDTFDFYRIMTGVGVLFYAGYIIDLYKKKKFKKKTDKKKKKWK